MNIQPIFFSQKRLVENPRHARTEWSQLETWQLAEYRITEYLAKRVSCTMLAMHACVLQCTVTACTLWSMATRNTAHSFRGKMLRKLGRGSPLVWISHNTIIVKQSLVYLCHCLCTEWNYSNREQTLIHTRTDPGYRYIVEQTLVHTMCCPRIHDNIGSDP